ncbi:B12 lower ligand biosynthesis radical SAM protein BzaD [Pseudoramibacter alactolyticus]|uniref:B12 lower ligand biosynthesis radical SAM protein BzaD n=1 Tax=Pseudoramibacter alactolyticus TaxID=113287 RepID=UPI0023566AE4|nr:B12 lower ligand biosynthesis radical SAM protein BzaD [Pseudoramibacter alactolyticus]MBM6968736.1 B12 lower ligand biosynthesis radical SAM protein BzaD [Pseudoramibacter alactolyticus]
MTNLTPRKKILLIQAISMEGMDIERVYPIGITTLGTIIRRSGRYAVRIIDMNMAANPYAGLEKIIAEWQPDVLGISLRNLDPLGNRTTSLIVPFALTLHFLQKFAPDLPLMAGGTAFTLFPERLMNDFPAITCGIVGEAENNAVAVVDALAAGETPPDIPGVIRRLATGGLRLTPPTGDFDMSQYEMIDRTLNDPSPYLAVNKYVESIGIETKRGCCFHCGYCSYPKLSGRCMRLRDPKSVVDEILYLKQRYGATRFHLTDSIVNFPTNHLDAICEELLRRDAHIHWSGFFREDLFTPESARLYAASGCESFSLSPDGLCQQHLDLLDKHLRVEQILTAAEILSRVGITTVYHYLVNLPGESPRTVRESKQMIDAIYDIHRGTKSLGTIVLNLVRIMPDTKIERLALAGGEITPDTDLLYPVYHDPAAYRTLRYELEIYHQQKNIAMWNGFAP